ncbi:MAG: hypothetical protein ACRDPA_06545, partial [Solirubrobacteraceae bacterium]
MHPRLLDPCARGKAYPIYVEVFSNGQLGQFYDVQGTTWDKVPMLAHPNQTLHVGKRTYDLFYDGSQLSTVAWHEYGSWYWVHNTLTDGVENGELLAIAEQTRPVNPVGPIAPGGAGKRGRAALNLRSVAAPTPTATTAPTSTRQTLGSLAGLLALLA